MSCSICDDKGFTEEVCPECEGSPDEIGGTGCSTCGGDGYIETPCEECSSETDDDEIDEECDETDYDEKDGENMLCPNCGSHRITLVGTGDLGGYEEWVCENCHCGFPKAERRLAQNVRRDHNLHRAEEDYEGSSGEDDYEDDD